MGINMKPTRYAHSEGHVDLTFDDSGRHLLTCGSDGDVRIYEGFEDDDPISHRVGDAAYSIAYNSNRFYVSSDDNVVKTYTFKDGEADGIVTRFMAPATHIAFNKNGTKLVAASSDFLVKLVDVETSSQKVFQGHEAPVLSIALHPKEHLLASSSCDGTVKIWNIEEQKCVKTIPGLPKSNDFGASQTLCRLTWNKDGNYLIVPFGTEVHLYDSTSWQTSFTLTDSCIKENVSITRFSPCWNYLAVACQDGQFVIWDFTERKVLERIKHPQKQTITALCWNPKGTNEIAYCDMNGGLGYIENIISGTILEEKVTFPKQTEDAVDPSIFDEEDNDFLIEATNPVVGGPSDVGGPVTDDDDDENVVDIAALKKEILGNFLDDENSKDSESGKTAEESSTAEDKDTKPLPTYVQGFEPTPLQPPFQPSSSPVHLSHRFMVWNSVGIIVQYNTDEENSINIEFHDTAVHHAMHVTNTLNHTMAALSDEAVLLACAADEDSPSKLVCMHFASWDSNKEWSMDLPSGENIKTICLGEGWAAIGTDKRLVRLFTIGGVQRQLISVPGPIVTLAGHSNQLMIIYHAGMAIPGDQCLGIRLQTVTGMKCSSKLNGEPLPLTPKSTLVWAGFSAEGTPFIMDSHGVIRMLNRMWANSWIQVANLKKLCKGKSDNYWLCSLHENPQQIRAILCKGSRYPPTLPRPTVQILSYQLPLCELSTDKATLEETLWRSQLMSQHLDWWDGQGFEVEDSAKSQALMPQQESLMKLFALACKTGREYRAVELCQLMPNHHTVQLAIKYASRLRMMQLAERLTEVAQQKAEEELMSAQRAMRRDVKDEDDDVDEEAEHELGFRIHTSIRRQPEKPVSAEEEEEMEEEEMEDDEDDDDADVSRDIYDEPGQEQTSKPKVPVLKFGSSKNREMTPKSICNSPTVSKNPFKVGSQKQTTPAATKGSQVFDSIEKTKLSHSHKTDEAESKKKSSTKQKRVVLKNKQSDQLRLFTSKKSKEQERCNSAGFKLWLDSNQNSLQEANPDVDDIEPIAEKEFNSLPSEEQEEWNRKAKSSNHQGELHKRKRDAMDEDDIENNENEFTKPTKKKISKKDQDQNSSQSGKSKLKNFVFDK